MFRVLLHNLCARRTRACRAKAVAGLARLGIVFSALVSLAVSAEESRSAEPPFVGQLVDNVLLRGVEDVYLDGDRAYLPCREGRRLTICSIKSATHPEILGTFTHPELDQAAGFALDGNTVYLGSHSNHKLFILDVSDAANIEMLGKVLIGTEKGPGGLYKVAYRDGYCYVALQQAKRLYVADVRDKAHPQVVSEVQVTTDDDGPFSVMLHDQYALVGTLFGHNNRLAVVDIRNPLQPRLVHALLDPDLCQVSGKFVGDRYIAVCWNENSLLVINLSDVANISDPSNPRFVTSFVHPVLKKAYGIAARGDLLFVGAREGNSLVVMDRRKLEPETRSAE